MMEEGSGGRWEGEGGGGSVRRALEGGKGGWLVK